MDVLFDIGSVIVGVDFIPSLKRLIPKEFTDAEKRLHKVLERKDEFEAGRITAEDYFPWAAESLGHSGSMDEFMHAWVDVFTPNNRMWKCIEELSSLDHRLILFSNINDPHKTHLLKNYPIFQHFTGGVFSYQTGHIKPEAEIYQLAINQYQLNPGQTLYIDDLQANIDAGKRAGFYCHQYSANRHKAFLNWLADFI